MAGVTDTKQKPGSGNVIDETGKDIDALQSDLAKYRSVFDSARLIVGHELKRPLTSIIGYVELLESSLEGSLGERELSYCGKIKDAVRRLDDIAESFIQMLRFDLKDEKSRSLDRLNVRGFVENMKSRFGEDSGRIEIDIAENLPLVYLKRSYLEIILGNLISNALKYSSESESVRVTAALRRERRGLSRRELLMIGVEDHGSGIPEHRIEEVFDPFCRLEEYEDSSGLGLGLALVKSVLAIMDGEVHVNSESGAGTTVMITVPTGNEPENPPDRVG